MSRQLQLLPLARSRKRSLAEELFERLGRELRAHSDAYQEATETMDDAERQRGGKWRESDVLGPDEVVIRDKRLND